MKEVNWNDVRYFNPKTDHLLKCPCCKLLLINSGSIYKLDIARKISNVAYNINSACRCKSHDKELHPEQVKLGIYSGKSSHIADKETGIYSSAFDIDTRNNRHRFRIVRGLILAGFSRLLIYPTFLHIDDDENKDQEIISLM
ncbi:unnamed protein product [marine sediment metagenome]|uniref:Uncharacterized protein n=1 Tax=marine sediment metagenome TaxID=412755 RepID=X1N0H5_9ZZZZ